MARGTSEPEEPDVPESGDPTGADDSEPAGRSPGVFVTVITAVALAVLGYVGYQAHAAPDEPLSAHGTPTAETDEDEADDEQETDGQDSADGPEPPGENPALPAESGQGERVVYALGERHVWLVSQAADGTGDQVLADYPVFPSTVDPAPGNYAVTSRSGEITGSDGVPIQHSVVFHADGEVVFGFSTALDGSVPDPDGEEQTGGIRQAEEHGDEMWEFASIGTPVVVVP